MKRMDVRQLDLNLLRVFAQLLRERQVSRAAVALGLSQPAVSNALRRLREELGDELFHRSARGMQPTAYALRIAPAVTQALDLIGRKTMQLQRAGLKAFLGLVQAFCAEHAGDEALAEFVGPLREKAGEWQALTLSIGKRAMGDPEEIGAATLRAHQ